MAKQRVVIKRQTRSGDVHRGIGSIKLKRFDPARDSCEALTQMLHRAFAKVGAMGLNCTCVDQPASITQARAMRGDCHVVVCDGHIIGTITLQPPDPDAPVALYRRNDVASIHQFGVDPAWQDRGIGKMLLAFAGNWAAKRGFAELALDTPQPADHLISFYRSQGFRIAGVAHFDGKCYDSVLLGKPSNATQTLAEWSHRLALPRAHLSRAA
jgi:GNAT superfamily N-acetyltransferase